MWLFNPWTPIHIMGGMWQCPSLKSCKNFGQIFSVNYFVARWAGRPLTLDSVSQSHWLCLWGVLNASHWVIPANKGASHKIPKNQEIPTLWKISKWPNCGNEGYWKHWINNLFIYKTKPKPNQYALCKVVHFNESGFLFFAWIGILVSLAKPS